MSVLVDRRTLLGAAATAGSAALLSAPPAQARRRVHPTSGLPAPGPILAAHADPADLGVLEAASLLQAAKLSSAELTAACQARIAARNGPVSFAGSASDINAFIRTYPSLAAQVAQAADRRLASGRRGGRPAPWLTGVPLALKDLYAVNGLPVTASSRILGGDVAAGVDVTSGGNTASGNSTAWQSLARAGMVLLGHAHTDEFAFLAVTPQCGNPWDRTLTTGGSSGGPAAALAARMTPAALGSDTLGSLRVPAAFCGVSSIKPTFGLVSSHGVIPLCWSLDTCGPMARSIADCALLLDQLAGPDPADATTLIADRPPARYPLTPRPGARPLSGVRIAAASNLGTPDAGPAEILVRTRAELESLGATLLELDVPADPFGTTGLLESYVDALAYHGQWFPARVGEYGRPAAQILAGVSALNVSAVQYLEIMRGRAAYQATWKAFLAEHRIDAVLSLVSLSDPVPRAAAATASPVSNPENSHLLTYVGAYLGFPAVTVPGGTSSVSRLPVGLQLMGAPLSEAPLIQLGIDLQAHFPHHLEDPFAR